MPAIDAFPLSVPPPSPMFTPRQAAPYLPEDLHPRPLERWRRTGGGPAFIKVGRRVGYLQRDLDDWIARQRREHTRDEPAMRRGSPKRAHPRVGGSVVGEGSADAARAAAR